MSRPECEDCGRPTKWQLYCPHCDGLAIILVPALAVGAALAAWILM